MDKSNFLNRKDAQHPRFCSFKVRISQISCGISHTSLITNTGYIYTNQKVLKISSELGISWFYNKLMTSPIRIGRSLLMRSQWSWSTGPKFKGNLLSSSKNSKFQGESNRIIDLDSGYNHSFLLTAQFALLSFGVGQLATDRNLSKQFQKHWLPQWKAYKTKLWL